MTINMIGVIKHYNGQSGEQNDSSLADVSEGSTFHAVDTGEKFIFHNGGWAEDLREIYIAEHI